MKVSVTLRDRKKFYQVRFRAKGREKSITLPKSMSKKEAEMERAHYERQIYLGQFDPWATVHETPSLSEAVRYYIEEKEGSAWNPESAKGQKIRLRQMLDHLEDGPLDHYRDWHWWRKPEWAPYTKKGFFITTRAFLKWCEKKGWIEYPDLQLSTQVKVKSRQKPLKAITREQLDDICRAYRWINMMHIKTGYSAGDSEPERHVQLWHVVFKLLLRKAEIRKVMPGDVERDYITLHRKGGKVQRLFIYDSLRPHIDWFREHQIPGKPFFGFEKMAPPALRLRRAARMALPEDFEGTYGFHMFRHGGITHMINQSVPIPVVSEYAGHATVSITLDRYAHVIDANKRESLNRL
jgi:integrase